MYIGLRRSIILFVFAFILISLGFFVLGVAGDSNPSGEDEWSMFGRHLNHSGYTASLAPINFSAETLTSFSGSDFETPLVHNTFVYIADLGPNILYQLNATNISQLIANYTVGGNIESVPAIANGYVYFGSY